MLIIVPALARSALVRCCERGRRQIFSGGDCGQSENELFLDQSSRHVNKYNQQEQ